MVQLWSRKTRQVSGAEEEQRFNAAVDLQEAGGLGEVFRQKAGQLAVCEVLGEQPCLEIEFRGVIRHGSAAPAWVAITHDLMAVLLDWS